MVVDRFSAETTTVTVFVPGVRVLAPLTEAMTALESLGLAATEIAVTSASTVAVYSCTLGEKEGLMDPGEMPRWERLLSDDFFVLVEELLVEELPEEELPEELFPEELLEELPELPEVFAPGAATVS